MVLHPECYRGYCLSNLQSRVEIFTATMQSIAGAPLPLVNKWYAATSLAESLRLWEPMGSWVCKLWGINSRHLVYAKDVIKSDWWLDRRSEKIDS